MTSTGVDVIVCVPVNTFLWEPIMENIENLFDKAVGEIERILSTKTAVGEPLEVEGNTLIPLVSVGFGFGVGEGQGKDPKNGSG